jgi:hypothetical protein
MTNDPTDALAPRVLQGELVDGEVGWRAAVRWPVSRLRVATQAGSAR